MFGWPFFLIKTQAIRRRPIPTDDYMLIGLGLVGLVVVWLVFSLIRKMFGLVLLAALVVGGFVLWNDPQLQASVIGMARDILGW
jgi:hypothetical protein